MIIEGNMRLVSVGEVAESRRKQREVVIGRLEG